MITLTNGVQIPENAVQLQTTAAIDGYYVTQPLRLVQYDQTLPVAAVQLTYQNQPYIPPTGAELNVRMGKPDGTTVYNPCLGMDSSGIVYFAFTLQMTIVAGYGTLTVEVTDSGVKNSAPIVVDIRRNPVPEGSIESADEFLTLQEILAEAEKWGQIVQTNAANIQEVVDNLPAIEAAPEAAQQAAASAAAAQQAAQEALGFRTFFSAVTPDANGNLDPSRPMTVGPAASVEIESAGDRIQSVTALGFTQQAGTGDPSPSNVRQLTNGGLKLVKLVLNDASGVQFQQTASGGNIFRMTVSTPAKANAESEVLLYTNQLFVPVSSDNRVSNPNQIRAYVEGAGASIVFRASQESNWDLSAFTTIVQNMAASGNPLTIWYVPADESQATGLYAPIILTSGEYRATCLPLTAPLCEGDSVVSWVKSGCDQQLTLDGSTLTVAASGSNYTVVAANAVAGGTVYASGLAGLSLTAGSITIPGTAFPSSVTNAGQANTWLQSNPQTLYYQSTAYTDANDIVVSLETHVKWPLTADGNSVKFYTTANPYQATIEMRIALRSKKMVPGSVGVGSAFKGISNVYNITTTNVFSYGNNDGSDIAVRMANTFTLESANELLANLYAAGTPAQFVYQLAAPITYAHPAVVLEAATGEQLTYTVTGQSGGTVSVALKPFQDGGHAATADNATQFDGHAWSEVPGQAPVQSVNGKTGAVQLSAADVGAQPTMTIEPLSITASGSGFAVNEGSFAVKYGALRIVFASITVNSVGSEGWVKVADISGASAAKTTHRVLASSGGTADSIAVYVNPNSIEMYLSNKDVGKTLYVNDVSYYV